MSLLRSNRSQRSKRHSSALQVAFPAPPLSLGDEKQDEWVVIGEHFDDGTATIEEGTAIARMMHGLPAKAISEANMHIVWTKVRRCLVHRAA